MNDLADHSLQEGLQEPEIDLDTMTEGELISLRSEIESRIKIKALQDVNLVQEALFQLAQARELQALANKKGGDVPVNQRAQVQNSLKNIISELAGMQMRLYDSEFVKRLESATVKVVKTLPKEQQDKFFELLDTEMTVTQMDMGEILTQEAASGVLVP